MSIFAEAETAAGGGTWRVFHPNESGPWTVEVTGRRGERVFLAYDPIDQSFSRVDPLDDPVLFHLRRWMPQGRLLTYRLGKKATVEVGPESGVGYAKIMTGWKIAELKEKLRIADAAGVAAGEGFPQFAPVVQQHRRFVLFGRLPGRSLRDILMLEPDAAYEALGATARSLACFHGVRLPAGNSTPQPSGTGYLLEVVRRHVPEVIPAYEQTIGRLDDFPQATSSPGDRLVHHDLHDRNIVVDRAEIGLLDLEYLDAGDPTDDIANLSAHIVLRELQRGDSTLPGAELVDWFLDSYAESGGRVDSAYLALVTARSLLHLSCLYLFRRRWSYLAPEILSRADEWIDRARENTAALGNAR